MIKGADKDTQQLARKAKKAGWTVELTRNNHIRFVPPHGQIIIAPLTGSGRSQLNVRRMVEKAIAAA